MVIIRRPAAQQTGSCRRVQHRYSRQCNTTWQPLLAWPVLLPGRTWWRVYMYTKGNKFWVGISYKNKLGVEIIFRIF